MEESEDKIMKSFPFDSQVTYDPQGNPTYDRGVNSADLADNISLLYTNGVLPNPSTCLQVTESENQMSVLVNPGACCINGRLGKEEEVRTIVFEASSSLYDRIDRVVLRLNTNIDVRAIDIYVVKGTPSASPVAPELTRVGGIYELGIADVFVAKNTTHISTARITDTRFVEDLCGIMKSRPEEIDIESLYRQMFEWMNYQENAFIEWVDTIKGILDEDVAGHLQSEIDDLVEDLEETNKTVTAIRSHIGMIIHSTTLDTEEKVKAIYGGNSWSKIEGRLLLGASSSYAINSVGGSADSIVPYHNHTFSGTASSHNHNFVRNGSAINGNALLLYSDSSYDSSISENGFKMESSYVAWTNTNKNMGAINNATITPSGSISYAGTSNNVIGANMPPYKAVYIWERVS